MVSRHSVDSYCRESSSAASLSVGGISLSRRRRRPYSQLATAAALLSPVVGLTLSRRPCPLSAALLSVGSLTLSWRPISQSAAASISVGGGNFICSVGGLSLCRRPIGLSLPLSAASPCRRHLPLSAASPSVGGLSLPLSVSYRPLPPSVGALSLCRRPLSVCRRPLSVCRRPLSLCPLSQLASLCW